LPIVCVDEIGRPGPVDEPTSDLCSGIAERREANVVVAPVDPAIIPVRLAHPFEETGANHDVIG
jgi:hypothetical protein